MPSLVLGPQSHTWWPPAPKAACIPCRWGVASLLHVANLLLGQSRDFVARVYHLDSNSFETMWFVRYTSVICVKFTGMCNHHHRCF